MPNFLTETSPKFIFEKDFLTSEIKTLLSLTLSSIKVPPLKSTQNFKPLKINRIVDIKIRNNEIKLKDL